MGSSLNIFDRWRIDGWVDTKDFVDLSGALGRSISYLCSDKILLHLCLIYAKHYGVSFDQRRIKRLIEDPRVWYPNYFPLELVKTKGKGGIIFAKDIALNYWIIKKKLFEIEEVNSDPNQQIYAELLVGNSLLRNDNLYYSINKYKQINKYFRLHEVLLYDSHHLRWLHVFNLAPQQRSDILLNLETGQIGIAKDFLGHKIVGLEFELFELQDLPLFDNRFYFPPDMAKAIAEQFPILLNPIAQAFNCWSNLFLPEIESNCQELTIPKGLSWNNLDMPELKLNKSAKPSVLKVLEQQGYLSPFRINY